MAKSNTNTAVGDRSNKKRSAAKEHEEGYKTLKKAKPSINKAAEELMCPILQDLPIDPVTAEDGQIYEREEIVKYLEKEGSAAISPVTRKRFKNRDLVPLVHVRNTIEHLVDSGIIEGEMADTWKLRMKEKRESEEKVKEWKEAAEKGDTGAMYQLAMSFANGTNGLKVDDEEAYKWCKKGADRRDVCCMAMASEFLLIGIGVEEDQVEGLIMLVSAANQGSDGACLHLGKVYLDGLYGSKVNYAEAKYWLEKAVGVCEHDQLSEQGFDYALSLIAKCNDFLEMESKSGDDSSEGESEDEE